jgi:hypothetical protein
VRVAWASILPAFVACAGSSAVPAAPPAPDGFAHVDRVARVCAKIASCAHAHDAPRDRDPSACVDGWLARARPSDAAFLRCVGAAPTCAALDACAKERGGDPVAEAYCRAHPGSATACDGTHLVTCSDDDAAESTSVDCAALEGTCGEVHAGGLVSRGCLSPHLCPTGAPEARCDGDAILTCRDGAADRTRCDVGARCIEQTLADTHSTMCETPGHKHCADVGKARCDGGKLVQCVPHGHLGEERVVDCGAMGLACDSSSSKPVCALPGQRACESGAPRCSGDALAFCAGGRSFEVKCASLGFARCDPDGHGLEASCGSAR